MLFKAFSYLELLQPLCSVERTICAILVEGPVIQEKMLFKDISYLELWSPFCSAEWNHLCYFGRRYHEEQLCEIILIWTSGSGGDGF